ncbi:HFX_2341 family transcriptional regulator domain-containing protein [Undibacterium macrobrachii]|uniref:HFX-2341-like N-terminal domain-containing protein n=1 Tax=Undibacterium macrobrachii TaxID=1119058 RepID=A0ABQ2XD26_9BURK|nr:DUF6293 family protein [Undibacterium macrobrachii]GGX10736.1 hypothetical protein GCM10011282_16290 [Undibacterium macrobrachii]
MNRVGLPATDFTHRNLGEIIDGRFILICHSSFEPRAEAILKLNFNNSALVTSLILATEESLLKPSYKERTDRLVNGLGTYAESKPRLISDKRASRIDWIRKLDLFFAEEGIDSLTAIVVDITAFPRDRMWYVLDYLKKLRPARRIHIIYTEPKKYSTEMKADGWLTRGVRNICAIPGFNGFQHTEKKSLLVLMVGHEYERAHITIKNTEPQKVVLLGQGLEQYRSDCPRLSDEVLVRIGKEFNSIVDLAFAAEINSRDYLSTRNTIDEIVNRYSSEFNLSIATFGTKLQSLGAFLACKEHRKIRAIYAEPQKYNDEDYSLDTGASWHVEI